MIFDLLVALVIVASAAMGAWKGFAWQVATILSLVAGFVVGIPGSKLFAPLFGPSAPFNRFLALGVIYLVISLGIYLLARRYHERIEEKKLHHWDRHLGGVFGAIRGFLRCLMLTFFALTLLPSLREPILATRTGRLMAATLTAIHPVLPAEVHDVLHPYIHRLDAPEQPAAPPPPKVDPSKHDEPHDH